MHAPLPLTPCHARHPATHAPPPLTPPLPRTPPALGQTDTCKNITFAGGNKSESKPPRKVNVRKNLRELASVDKRLLTFILDLWNVAWLQTPHVKRFLPLCCSSWRCTCGLHRNVAGQKLQVYGRSPVKCLALLVSSPTEKYDFQYSWIILLLNKTSIITKWIQLYFPIT